MKVAIVYGTNREKAMVKVVKWLEAGFTSEGHEVKVGRPNEFDSFDYDVFVIGSSIYAGNAVEGVLDYVGTNSDKLSEKNVATFLVCKETKCPEDQIVQIHERLKKEPLTQMFIEGYMFREKNFKRQESKALEWTKEILGKVA
jgi:menaquinone-dependent protoporphyrinogen IX oxidase